MAEGKIYSAICACMADIGAVGKNSRNSAQGFMFRGIDAVMNAINPALIKHGIFVVPEVLEQTREERTNAKGTTLIYSVCRIKYTFCAADGSSVSAVVIGEGMDSGDKATNKAMSIAFKYACFQVFCIPTEEMKDPDAESHEVQPRQHRQTAQQEQPKRDLHKEVEQALLKNGIYVDTILNLYKVDSIASMSDAKCENVLANIEKIKAKQEESK